MPMKLRRLWIQLTSDRRRFGMLCVVLCVGMLLWARLIVVSRMPRTAIAGGAVAGAKSMDGRAQKSGASPHVSKPSASAAPTSIELSPFVARDPFVISPRFFPRPTSFAELPKEPSKSGSKAAEEPYQAEARLIAELRAVVDRMRLEAAVAGSMAVINGKTIRVGDLVRAAGELPGADSVSTQFRLEEVKHRSAILECQGRRFEIQMSSPGG